MNADNDRLLGKHRDTDRLSRTDADLLFVSGWHTTNPFRALMNMSDIDRDIQLSDKFSYSFLSDCKELTDSIRTFHRACDGIDYSDREVFPSTGSSALIASFFFMIKSLGIDEVLYVPPLYYTNYYMAKMLDIKLTRIAQGPLINDSVEISLPEKKCWLVLADPIWMMGLPVPRHHISLIVDWQRRTNSYVFVDGTFQYMNWENPNNELSSKLDRHLTFRVVCPTKSVVIHGFRFAYMILPSDMREEIRYPSSNICGASGAINTSGSLWIMSQLNSSNGNQLIRKHIRGRHEVLNGVLYESPLGRPSCSYYVFAKPLISREVCLTMDQDFFDIAGYPEYVRFNLLMPPQTIERLGIKQDIE